MGNHKCKEEITTSIVEFPYSLCQRAFSTVEPSNHDCNVNASCISVTIDSPFYLVFMDNTELQWNTVTIAQGEYMPMTFSRNDVNSITLCELTNINRSYDVLEYRQSYDFLYIGQLNMDCNGTLLDNTILLSFNNDEPMFIDINALILSPYAPSVIQTFQNSMYRFLKSSKQLFI